MSAAEEGRERPDEAAARVAAVTTGEGGEEERRERGVVAGLVDRAKGFVAEKIAQIPKPDATLDRVSFKGVSRECITLHSHVDVNNPYAHRIPICELTYTFKSGGKVIASGTMPDPGWIAASGTTKLELPVKVPYDFIMSLIKDLGGDWDIDYVLEVGVTIDLPVIGSFTIPLTTEGEMKLPTFRDLF
uniref:Water stress and hypersensitive response domain-containing protein n=1 Tax=Leersia perrieri TaxID=77586 RepID=A0A0D9V338_9ORYZ